jgi:hypothetical protein
MKPLIPIARARATYPPATGHVSDPAAQNAKAFVAASAIGQSHNFGLSKQVLRNSRGHHHRLWGLPHASGEGNTAATAS